MVLCPFFYGLKYEILWQNSHMNELVESKASFEGVLSSFTNNDTFQRDHVVICGQCGAVEQPLGPHKSECPNCDDYIY